MVASVAYNLKNLLNFKGRDGRRVFWHYFLFVVLINIAVMAVVAVPALGAIFGDVAKVSGGASADAIEAEVLKRMIDVGLPQTLARLSLGMAFLNMILLAASIVRRAHDAGLPGMVGLIPLFLQLVWMFFAYGQLGGLEQSMRHAAEVREAGQAAQVQPGMIAQDLIGWLVVLVVILLGLAKSQSGANQYGEGPTLI
jgi:uncharacterized membrane protein YhaH (DUF805 family)